MAIRTIREAGDNILRKKSKPVKNINERTLELIDDMIDTLFEYDGVGLAAVQVGVLKRIAVINIPGPEEYDDLTDDLDEAEAEAAAELETEAAAELEAAAAAGSEAAAAELEAEAAADAPDDETAEELDDDYDMTHTYGENIILINPSWEALDDTVQRGSEGCLSVPGKNGIVTRPDHVLVKAFDEEMKPFELEARGLLARAICHECDHLDGVLYIDKVEGRVRDNSEEAEDDDTV